MTLLIRYDPAESVLRSVGAPPNGIVGVGWPDGCASWLIDAAYQPPAKGLLPAGASVDQRTSRTGVGEASTPVEAADLVAGLEGHHEAIGLIKLSIASIASSLDVAGPGLNFEVVASHVELAIATRDALIAYGFLRPVEAPDA